MQWSMRHRFGAAAVLTAALAIRAPLVLPSLPYLGYVDEGHVLHPVLTLLRTGGWDPQWYLHPSLTIYLITLLVHVMRSEEHTSELQSLRHLVCRLLLEKKQTGPALRTSPVAVPRDIVAEGYGRGC